MRVTRTQISLQRRENSAHPTQGGDMGTVRAAAAEFRGQQLSLPFAEQHILGAWSL